jgi:MYXO-CTERM domain-containing protein
MKCVSSTSRVVVSLACTSLVAMVSQLQAAVVTSGLLVDLDAANFTPGGVWANAGALGGSFAGLGTPTKATADGVSGVFFDGSDGFVGPRAPGGITGNATRTVETWVYQGNVNSEETLVAWGRRGGGDGTNNSFNWGTNGTFGAYGGWGGGPDMGYGAGQPAKGAWHHIVYTYDGANKSVYVDGNLANAEADATLNTHASHEILLGAQHAAASVPGAPNVDGANRLGGIIGRVRVHDGVLTAADVLNNFNEEKSVFQLPVLPKSPLAAAPVHRWSFNEASGTIFANTGTLGGGVAVLKGAGGVVTGSGVDLPGGASATQGYIDLPNGVASGKDAGAGYGSVSYEVWVTAQNPTTWGRVLDFGTNSAGEVTDAGGSFNGTQYILLSNNIANGGDMRMEMLGTTQNGTRDAIGATILGSQQHIVMTYDAGDGMWKWYRNGELMEGFAGAAPSSLNDVNNWLGRSNWAGDANTDALYDEFRIYDYALSDAQVRQNLVDGPNLVTVVPEPTAGLLGLAGFGLLARRRR